MLDRKQEILDVAAELLQTRSFSAFSYQDISERIGISKATLHHHFASKEDLGIALAERFLVQTKSVLQEITQHHQKPWDQFGAYLGFVSDTMRSGTKICCGGVLQAEHNVIPEAMRERISQLHSFVLTWLSSLLAEGRRQGTMRFDGKPEDQAALVQAAMQGALQQARARGPGQFTAVVRQLKSSMKAKS